MTLIYICLFYLIISLTTTSSSLIASLWMWQAGLAVLYVAIIRFREAWIEWLSLPSHMTRNGGRLTYSVVAGLGWGFATFPVVTILGPLWWFRFHRKG